MVNIILQIYIINLFLDGRFLTYGWDAMQFYLDPPSEDITNPTDIVFPKVTKCVFRLFGSSGSVQEFDNLCLLALNIVHEKIYIFLWWWFLILSILSTLAVVYRMGCMASIGLRYYCIRLYNQFVDEKTFNTALRTLNYGDWFVFYLLSKNMDAMHYKYLMELYILSLHNPHTEIRKLTENLRKPNKSEEVYITLPNPGEEIVGEEPVQPIDTVDDRGFEKSKDPKSEKTGKSS